MVSVDVLNELMNREFAKYTITIEHETVNYVDGDLSEMSGSITLQADRQLGASYTMYYSTSTWDIEARTTEGPIENTFTDRYYGVEIDQEQS